MAACDAAEPDEACALVHRAAPNGAGLNGIHINGTPSNGTQTNGGPANGIQINGLPQGTMLGGIEVAGARLDGTALLLLDAEHQPIGDPEALVGTLLPTSTSTGEPLPVRVDGFERDPVRADLVYYTLTLDGQNICGDDGVGFFVEGAWDHSGARHDTSDGSATISFSCMTGVIAKCVVWGYAPYTVGADAHQSCTRLARADYCGDGVPHTVDGTEIDVFDRLGVMRPDASLDLVFEAGWGPDGAVCVNEPRWVDLLPDGEQLLPTCWDDLPRCATEDEAHARGATLANRSHNEARSVCE